MARLLGSRAYGEFGIIQSTIGMVGTFAGLGLGVTATKHIAELRETDAVRAGRILTLSFVAALVSGVALSVTLWLCAPWLASHSLNAPHLTPALRMGCAILLLGALNGAQAGALAGFESFRQMAFVNVATAVLSVPVLVVFSARWGVVGAVASQALYMAATWVLNHMALRHSARRNGISVIAKGAGKEWPILWHYSLPAMLGSIVVGPVNWACAAMLVNQTHGYEQMGLFSAATQWRAAILFIPTVVGQVALPLLANMLGRRNADGYISVLKLQITTNAAVSLLVVLPIVVMASPIMRAYGAEYHRGVTPLRLLAASAVLMSVNNVVGSAIASHGRMWLGVSFNAAWAVVLLVAASLMLQRGMGATGLAVATLLAYALHTGWQGAFVWMTLKRGRLAPGEVEAKGASSRG